MCMSIEALEQHFEPMVNEALQKKRTKQRRSSTREGHETDPADKKVSGETPSAMPSRKESDAENDEDDEEGLCVVCLDARAEMVMRACGHLVFCTKCRRRIIALAKGVRNIKDISANHSEK